MRKHRRALSSLVLALLPACGGHAAAVGPGSSPIETLSVKVETPHFRVLAGNTGAADLRQVADALEASCARIAADLDVTDLRTTSAEVWSDAESFYARMQARTGTRFDGAAGYVIGPADFAVLARPGGSLARASVHEFSHCVSLRLNPSIGNNPRWLWETVALYEAGEFVDPRAVSFLRSGSFPTIAQLDVSYDTGRQVYQVGFVLGEFIAATWGRSGLVGLVRANGDIERALGIKVPEFEERWQAFVRQKYLATGPA